MTFRQRLRGQSEEQLNKIIKLAYDAVDKAKGGTKISTVNLMRMCSGTQTKTLRDQLVTQLSNEAEAELEAIYNRQQGLDLGEGDD